MGKTSDTLVTVATYNEIENLPRLKDEVFAVAPQVDFLVIDDNSPDGTGDWCDTQAALDPRVNCVHRAGKLGLGTATIAAMKTSSSVQPDSQLPTALSAPGAPSSL